MFSSLILLILCWSILCCCDKIPEKNQLVSGKDLFHFMVLEFSFHGHLVPLSLACGKAAHPGREHMGEETAHLMQERNRERKVGVRIPSRPCPQ
jgi:hypothetical protein